MIIKIKGKEKKLHVGSWAKPFVEELLRGNYVHTPTIYLPPKVRKKWGVSYDRRWLYVTNSLQGMGLGIIRIPNNTNHYDEILILEKFFKRFLKERLIEQDKKRAIYRVESRLILQFKSVKDNSFRVLPYGIKTFADLSVEKKIQDILAGDEDHRFVEQRQMEEVLDKLDGKMQCPGRWAGDNDHDDFSGMVFHSRKGNIYSCIKHLSHFKSLYKEVRHVQRRKLINELRREARTRSN